ncbi:MAG: hypothetical protein AUI36_07850 [Cyanobacteria bacterium 13_1_40CM_2_61_4]|nr:MAG: hypothetical protein AUI36_07850 [Cyanobacteria bacterium 13_1_40CM_2_61_4]
MSSDGLAGTLDRLSYTQLFLQLDDEAQGKIWSRPQAESDLRSIVLDTRKSERTRFLAAELLAARSKRLAKAVPGDVLAQVYVGGLRSGASQMANPWGLPGSTGPLSERVLALGKVATAPLLEALDDAEPMVYSGSREASIGNSYQWRVKDQAASLLAALRGERLAPDSDPRKRDKAIAALRERVRKNG